MAWTVKGVASAALDATARSWETLRVENWGLAFKSMADDVLTWTAKTEDATGTGAIIPDLGQIVELFLGSTRKFKGHAGKPVVELASVTVTVYGPWWWLSRTPLTQLTDDATEVEAERTSYVFPTQQLKTSLESLIARAIANGVPMVLGTVDAFYSVPKITLSNMSCAAALAELLRWAPDAVVSFDYSGTTPAINITRRGNMDPLTYTVGTDKVETAKIAPRLDLEVERVELAYVTRQATTGLPQWANQGGGSATPAAGKRQMITVSGPEIADFLPKDDFDSVTVQTANAAISSALVAQRDAGLSAIVRTYGYLPGTIADYINYYVTSYDPGAYNNRALFTRWFPVRYTITDDAGTIIPTSSSKKLVISGDLPEWAMTLLGGVRVQITGTWVATNTSGVYSDVEKAIQLGGFGFMGGWVYQSGTDTYYVSGRSFSISGVLIDTAYLTPTAIYKPWDYDYLTPPAGLATELAAAQAWVPWEGPIRIVGDPIDGSNLLNKTFNLAASQPACAIMNALAKGISYDGLLSRLTIDLGAPARNDYGSLVSRIKREPKDNIVYL